MTSTTDTGQPAGPTPGPWTLEGSIYEHTEAEIVGGGHGIAQVWKGPNGCCDARLIATAPDLLEALKAAREALAEAQRADSIIGTAIVSAEVNLSVPYGAAILIIEARESVAREIARIDALLSSVQP